MPSLWKSLRDNAAIIVIGIGVLGSYVSVMARLAVVESEVTGLKTMLVKAIDSKILSSR